MEKIEKITLKTLDANFGDIKVYTQVMKVKQVLQIYYVAVRGRDKEEGAVQRVLNNSRVKEISKYVLNGNIFYSSFILNWTRTDSQPIISQDVIEIPIIPSSAQVIDGQHRIAGLEMAIEEKPEIGEKDILVTFAINLTTQQAASIFLNINTEQKPVPKSLIYDLFGEINNNIDLPITRAADIANDLNTDQNSPYYGAIKFPGTARGIGIIDLSTIVSSIKDHLDDNGTFATYKIYSYDKQKTIISNYFNSIKYFYSKEGIWNNKTKNPFYSNAGFIGASEVLFNDLMPKCAERKSFTEETFKTLLNLNNNPLMEKSEMKSLDGKSQRKRISDYLKSNIQMYLPDQDEYKF